MKNTKQYLKAFDGIATESDKIIAEGAYKLAKAQVNFINNIDNHLKDFESDLIVEQEEGGFSILINENDIL
jgi:hypothetical protein